MWVTINTLLLLILCMLAFMTFYAVKKYILTDTDDAPTDYARLRIDMFDVWNVNDEVIPPHYEIAETKGVDVHDHVVQDSLTTSFKALKNWYDRTEQEDTDSLSLITLTSIKSAIFRYPGSVDTIEKAYSTVRNIEKHNVKIESIDTDELTVLKMVWKRINEPVNATVKDDLIESLINQLADASIDLDLSRCASGRVTRIIQSLEAIDTEQIVMLASTEDIARELADKVPVLIERFINEDNMIGLIDGELRKDYVDTKLLTESMYLKIVRDYLDAAEDYRTSVSHTGHLVENDDNQPVIQSR